MIAGAASHARDERVLAQPVFGQQSDRSVAQRDEGFSALQRAEQLRQRRGLAVVVHIRVQLEPVDARADADAHAARPSIHAAGPFDAPIVGEQRANGAQRVRRGKLQHLRARIVVPLHSTTHTVERLGMTSLRIDVPPDRAVRLRHADERVAALGSYLHAGVVEGQLGREPIGARRGSQPQARSRIAVDDFDAQFVRRLGRRWGQREQCVDKRRARLERPRRGRHRRGAPIVGPLTYSEARPTEHHLSRARASRWERAL